MEYFCAPLSPLQLTHCSPVLWPKGLYCWQDSWGLIWFGKNLLSSKEEVIIFLFWSKLESERWAWNRAIQISFSDLCPLHIHSSEKKAAWRTTVSHKNTELEDEREWLNTRLNVSFMLMITYRDLINDSVQGIVRGFALPFLFCSVFRSFFPLEDNVRVLKFILICHYIHLSLFERASFFNKVSFFFFFMCCYIRMEYLGEALSTAVLHRMGWHVGKQLFYSIWSLLTQTTNQSFRGFIFTLAGDWQRVFTANLFASFPEQKTHKGQRFSW